jgi:hypothetical protein
LEPSASDGLKIAINAIFPPVSLIMHLDATTMDKVFKKCLLFKEKGTNTIIDWYAWDQFIIEHTLDIEVTKIKINSKTHHLVRLGSFEDSLANNAVDSYLEKSGVPQIFASIDCPVILRLMLDAWGSLWMIRHRRDKCFITFALHPTTSYKIKLQQELER